MAPEPSEANQIVVPKVILPKKKSAVNGSNGDNGNNGEVYEIMERKDEQQIIAELQGRYLDEFVYEFEQELRQKLWEWIKEPLVKTKRDSRPAVHID